METKKIDSFLIKIGAILLVLLLAMYLMVIGYRNSRSIDSRNHYLAGVELVPKINQVILKYHSKNFDPQIVLYDPNKRYLVIKIVGSDAKYTDDVCAYSAKLFNALCSLGLTLELQGPFVPSRVNPMTSAWTKQLVGDGHY